MVAGLAHRFENAFAVESEFIWNELGDTGNLEAALLRFRDGETFDLSEPNASVVADHFNARRWRSP